MEHIFAHGLRSIEDTPADGLFMGKTKIALSHGHTIPRLKLCSALLAVEIKQVIDEQLQMTLNSVKFYS